MGKKKKDEDKVNTNLVKVTIYRPISDTLVRKVSSFIVAETPDENRNLIATSKDNKYKEDHNFSRDRVYEVLEYSLNLNNKNKTRAEKRTIIKTEIKKYEKELIDLKKNVKNNDNINYEDKDLKLRQLRVLYDSFKKEKKGEYMRLDDNGMRQYEFVNVDGVLYPYHFGSNFFRVYPDLTIKKKIFNQENTIFNNELNHGRETKIFTTGMVILIISLVFLVGNVIGGFWLVKESNSIDERASSALLMCTQSVAQLDIQYGNVINDYLETKQADLEILKKNQNNNINSGGNININPSQIIQ